VRELAFEKFDQVHTNLKAHESWVWHKDKAAMTLFTGASPKCLLDSPKAMRLWMTIASDYLDVLCKSPSDSVLNRASDFFFDSFQRGIFHDLRKAKGDGLSSAKAELSTVFSQYRKLHERYQEAKRTIVRPYVIIAADLAPGPLAWCDQFINGWVYYDDAMRLSGAEADQIRRQNKSSSSIEAEFDKWESQKCADPVLEEARLIAYVQTKTEYEKAAKSATDRRLDSAEYYFDKAIRGQLASEDFDVRDFLNLAAQIPKICWDGSVLQLNREDYVNLAVARHFDGLVKANRVTPSVQEIEDFRVYLKLALLICAPDGRPEDYVSILEGHSERSEVADGIFWSLLDVPIDRGSGNHEIMNRFAKRFGRM
jgi:hypothetical protein